MIAMLMAMTLTASPGQVPAPAPVVPLPAIVIRQQLIQFRAVELQAPATKRGGAATAPKKSPDSAPAMKPGLASSGPPVFEIRTTDESSIRVSILDSTLELSTSFGPLVVPVKDVRKLEIGIRLSEDDSKQILAAVAKLIDPDRKTRLLGREAALAIPAKSLPAIRRIKMNIVDPEILSSIADVETRLVSALKEKGEKEIVDRDTIRTDGSTFIGTIVSKQLKVQTGPFGEQTLKLTDVQSARSLITEVEGEDEGELIALPPNGMIMFQGQFGKVYRIRVTGTANNNIWGTGTYTLDSYLPMAAVHAGAIKNGETATVKVKIVTSPNQFTGSSQNGVGSAAYGQYPAGAFEFLTKKSD